MKSLGRLAIPALVLFVALGAWWAWSAHEARLQHRTIAALVAEASADMRTWLDGTVTNEHVVAAESRLEALQDVDATRKHDFARAAEDYLLGARALAQRRVDVGRLATHAEATRRALAAHMAGAARRDSQWIREATELRRRVEEAYGDLARMHEAVAELAAGMPDSVRTLAPYVPRASLVSESAFVAARRRAEAQAEAARAERTKLGQLR